MKGFVYKIECMKTNKFYIGSTTQTIKKRLKNHKSKAKEPCRQNTPLYSHFNSVGWENANIVLLFESDVETKSDLLILEKNEIMKVLNTSDCMNVARPCITQEERSIHDREYSRQRYKDNKDSERDRIKIWREKNPEKYKLQLQRSSEKQRIKRSSPTTSCSFQ